MPGEIAVPQQDGSFARVPKSTIRGPYTDEARPRSLLPLETQKPQGKKGDNTTGGRLERSGQQRDLLETSERAAQAGRVEQPAPRNVSSERSDQAASPDIRPAPDTRASL